MSDNNESYVIVEQGSSGQQERDYESFWSENETFALLSCYENHIDDFRQTKKRKIVWKIISDELLNVGIMRTPEKCERKWLNLIRIYRNRKDNQSKPGRSNSVANKYYARIEEILGDPLSFSNNIVVDIGLSTETLRAEETPEEDVENEIRKSPKTEREDKTPSKKIKLTENSDTNKVEYWKLKLRAKEKESERREERHREFVALEKERLAIELRKIKALEKYLKNKGNNN